VDLISGGRAEIIAGRGVFTEPFPLFGVDLRDYDQLFSEKLDLLRKLTRTERVTWRGDFRSALRDAEMSPRSIQRELPIWIGVGVHRRVRSARALSVCDGIGGPGRPDRCHQTNR
jgi:alkanesulfonate monooxygenase SsuD/methylene tetrahydromethanopterin reductase-like flavin-dependent oxidoreductase (luciferase family)